MSPQPKRSPLPLLAALALAALLFSAPPARAAETRLEYDPALWQRKLFNTGGVAEAEAAVFTFSKDAVAVGPWTAGEMSARVEYRKRIPLPKGEGVILGRYRTEGLLPRQAELRVQFYAGERALEKRSFALAAAPEGAELKVAVRRPPAGADALAVGFGLNEQTSGRVTFSDLRVSDQPEPLNFDQLPELTRPRPPQGLKPSETTRLERAGDAWWLVDPAGKPFFSLGSTLYGVKSADKKGAAQEQAMFEQMRRLGLNSTAGSHDLRRWAAFNKAQARAGRPTVMQFYTFETRVSDDYDTLVNAAGNNPGQSQAQAAAKGAFNHAFPDPFDPRWEAAFRKRVHEYAGLVRGKPWFGGWFVDNERAHENIHRYVWSKNCAAELRKFLEKKYPSIDALNKAWGSSFASFDDLMQKKPDPALRRGAMFEDFRLFSREVIRRFNQATLRIVREEDPTHLVFSNRFMLGEVGDMLENLDLYRDFDAIAVNIYPQNDAPGLNAAERQLIETIHQRTGRPVLISEWSVPALDSGLYNNPERRDWSYPQAVETQAQRARQAALIEADLYNMPFVIGAHWFSWADFDSGKRQANRGLFKANGQPWPELQQALGGLNQAIGAR